MISLSPERPWPGLSSFTETDSEYFYGRETEVSELQERISGSTLTVLYGVSGYGKSSIIKAGLIPLLRKEGMIPVLFPRFDFDKQKSLAFKVVEYLHTSTNSQTLAEDIANLSLWEYFHLKSLPWNLPEKSKPMVLIFDQFEDLFTRGEDRGGDYSRNAQEFIKNLADLVENRPPSGLREKLRSNRELVKLYDFNSTSIKVLIVLRDDFLSRLERWRRIMPRMIENRMELRVLTGPKALESVMGASSKRPNQPPIINEETAEAIIRFVAGLSNETPLENIENTPSFLSLVCQQLNERRFSKSDSTILDRPDIPLEWVIEKRGGLSRITAAVEVLQEFYESSFSVHPLAVRRFVEYFLVSEGGYRETVSLDNARSILSTDGITDSQQTLDQLVNQRIIMIEERRGILRIELTHDILARLAHKQRRIGILNDKIAEFRQLDQNYNIPLKDKLELIDQNIKGLPALDFSDITIRDLYAHVLIIGALIALQGYDLDTTHTFTNIMKTKLNESLEHLPPLLRSQWKYIQACIGYHELKYEDPMQQLNEAMELIENNSQIEAAIHRSRLKQQKTKLLLDASDPEAIMTAESAISDIKLLLKESSLTQVQINEGHIILFSLYYLIFKFWDNNANTRKIHAILPSIQEDFQYLMELCQSQRMEYDPRFIIADALFQEISITTKFYKGLKVDAVEDISISSVDKVIRIVEKDISNLYHLYILGYLLKTRISFAISDDDVPQLKMDIVTIREISKKLETGSQRFAFNLQLGWIRHVAEMLLSTNIEEKTERRTRIIKTINTFIEHTKLLRNSGSDSPLLEWSEYFLAIDLIKLWTYEIKDKDKDKDKVARKIANYVSITLVILNNLESKVKNLPATIYRVYLFSSVLDDSEYILSEDLRNEYFDQVIQLKDEFLEQISDDYDSQMLLCNILSLKASQLKQINQITHAIGYLEEVKMIYMKAISIAPSTSYIRGSFLNFSIFLAKCYSLQADWNNFLTLADTVNQQILIGSEPLASELPKEWETYQSKLSIIVEETIIQHGLKDKRIIEQLRKSCRKNEATLKVIKKRALSYNSDNKNQYLTFNLKAVKLHDELKVGYKHKILEVKQQLGWSTPPVYSSSWQTLLGTDFDDALQKFLSCSMDPPIAEVLRIRSTNLPFYSSGEVIEAEYISTTGKLTIGRILTISNNVFHLDGSSNPIHDANELGPIQLNNSNQVSAYLRFFCVFVQGSDGTFPIIEYGNDIHWLSTATMDERRSVSRLIRPLVVWQDAQDNETWLATGTVLYGVTLYHSSFQIDKVGMVNMTSDQDLATDLSVNTFISSMSGKVGYEVKAIDLNLLGIIPEDLA
jgi:hypothetical protein